MVTSLRSVPNYLFDSILFLIFREFQEENHRQQQLFQSEHQTDDGAALIPIKKIIAFDCPADGAEEPDDIFVGIKGK